MRSDKQFASRRQFFSSGSHLLGSAALASLAMGGTRTARGNEALGGSDNTSQPFAPPAALGPHFPPTAKRVIFLHMVGGPSQMYLFDF